MLTKQRVDLNGSPRRPRALPPTKDTTRVLQVDTIKALPVDTTRAPLTVATIRAATRLKVATEAHNLTTTRTVVMAVVTAVAMVAATVTTTHLSSSTVSQRLSRSLSNRVRKRSLVWARARV